MRVLVAYASKRGGTTGIAKTITARLRQRGIDADACPALDVGDVDGYDAFVVGSALYRGRWQRPAVRVLRRLVKRRDRPRVWLFHSGPLGDEAGAAQPLPSRVANMASLLEGGHVETFGGRLEPDTNGLLARSMVRNGLDGDWRDCEQMYRAADRIADALLGTEQAAF